jgi:hypothetical protein
MMTEFNETESTNQYLVSALILARKNNEILTENNRRLERLLIKAIKDLQEGSLLMDNLRKMVDDLTTVVTSKAVKL